jgi:prepilin-type N-terminal cleavage/methylation domain-containing protein
MAKICGFRKGLTLIEVLVSLTIFLVVLLAIYQLFDTSHATYASGTKKQDVQQQARLAMDEIVRTLRMAGYVSENFDATAGNELTGTARIHTGTNNFLAVFGTLDESTYNPGPPAVPASHVFVYCQPAGTNTLLVKRSTDPTNALTYNCNNTNTTYVASGVQHEIRSDVMANDVTLLRFTYFDQNGNQLASDLDGKTAGAALDLAPRTQRDAVRTIVITLQITEQVVQHAVGQTPRQPDQVYTLTSTVRLRNLNNT